MTIKVGDTVRLLDSRTQGTLDGALAVVEAADEDYLTVRVHESAITDSVREAFENEKDWAQQFTDTSEWDIQVLHIYADEVELAEEIAA